MSLTRETYAKWLHRPLFKKKKIFEKVMKSSEEHDTRRVNETSKQDTGNEKIHGLELFKVI